VEVKTRRHFLFALGLAGCGGLTLGSGGGTSEGGDGADTVADGAGPSEGSVDASDARESRDSPRDARTSLPEVGSPECVMEGGVCVLCGDDQWHCDEYVLPPCPAGIGSGQSCTGEAYCLTCGSGEDGTEWSCARGGHWLIVGGFYCL
jgi:hypothetical protein